MISKPNRRYGHSFGTLRGAMPDFERSIPALADIEADITADPV